MSKTTIIKPREGFCEKQRFGLLAECWTVEQLCKRGYDAKLNREFTADYDILIDGILRCEVKIARNTLRLVRAGYRRPCWQFDLSRSKQHQDMVFILICEDSQRYWYPFIVPSWFLFGRWGFNITSHPTIYHGMLANCLDNWSNVLTVLETRQHFMGLAERITQ
jgi:hypothetical protein